MATKVSLFTRDFWRDAIERAVKTIAQTSVALLGVDTVNLISFDWQGFLVAIGLAGLISLLTSVGSAQATGTDSGSLIQ